MVPPNWEHPQKDEYDVIRRRMEKRYQPLYDQPYKEAIAEWLKDHLLWVDGKHPDQLDGTAAGYENYADWGGNAPDVKYYRPNWKEEDRTWFQVYETVSEGTPVTPPFATKEELVEYLVTNGDLWDQRRRAEGNTIMNCDPWSRKTAEHFVYGTGWAPSMIMDSQGLRSGVEAMADLPRVSDRSGTPEPVSGEE